MTDQEKAISALMYRWFEEVWNKGRAEVIDELLAPDCVIHGLRHAEGDPMTGPAGFKRFFERFHSTFPDIRIRVEDVLVTDDRAAARCHVTATHTGDTLGIAPTRKPIEFTGMAVARFENGKIVEGWNNFDLMRMYQQIGMISDAF